MDDAVHTRHADVVEARTLAPQQLRGDAGFLRDGDVGSPRGHDEDGTSVRLRRRPDRNDCGPFVVRHPLPVQCFLEPLIEGAGGPGRQHQVMGLAHPLCDLHDPPGRLAQAQDDLRISAAEVAVRVELREPEVLVRQVAERLHRLAHGDLPRLQVSKERLHPTPVHGPHRICSHFSSSRTELRVPPRLISSRIRFSRSSTSRARFAISTASSRATTIRPDSSPTIQSPVWTFCPPHSISLPISPRPFGSPACGATCRLKHGKFSSRIVSRSRTAPSITTPATPFTRQEFEASSPQTAVGPPPTSITMTSPDFARSIASTGFAQSPSAVLTVRARPTSFVPCLIRGTRPVITPRFCIASARFGEETWRNASPTSASVYFLYRPVGIDFLWRIAFLIVRVASATFSALMIAPPTMTIVASSVTPMTVMTSAPAFAAISTSNAPVSIVLRSATIVFPGNDFFSCRTTSMPSDLTSGVPASSQSAPPSTASFAASKARFRCMWSRATWRTGSMDRAYLALILKT